MLLQLVQLLSTLHSMVTIVRPRASDASIHPFHWSLKKRLLFLKDASDRLEVEKVFEEYNL